MERSENTLRSIVKAWPPPLVRDVNPYQLLGVFQSTIAEEPFPAGAVRPPYVERTVDDTLRTALGSHRLVVLRGPSKAGKSRTAYEALAAVFPDRRLIVPIAPVTRSEAGAAGAPLLALADSPSFGGGLEAVLWLDDVERHIRPGHLTVDVLDTLSNSFRNLVVIATIRDGALNALNQIDGLAPTIADVFGDPTAVEIRLSPRLTDAELASAADRYPAFSRRPNLRRLGEFFAAADDLLEKYQEGSELNPIGAAVTRAALDWQRVGMVRPITASELYELTRLYLAEINVGIDLTDAGFNDGLRWARDPVSSSAALLIPVDDIEPGFRVFDFLLEWATMPSTVPLPAQTMPSRLVSNEESVPDFTWRYAVARAQAGDWLTIAIAARLAGQRSIEAATWSHAVTVPGPSGLLASYMHGNFLQLSGDPDAAVTAYQRVLDGDHDEYVPPAAFELGQLYQRRGDLVRAKAVYEVAIKKGGTLTGLSELYLSTVFRDEGDDEAYKGHRDRAMAIGEWSALENQIAASGDSDAGEEAVRTALESSPVLALGTPAGETSVRGTGTETQLLHFAVDDERYEGLELAPVFTRPEFVASAIIRNSAWQWLPVLVLDSAALLANIDLDVILVINPWTPLEFQLPPPPHEASRL